MQLFLLFASIFVSCTALCPDGFALAYNGQCTKEVEDAQLENTVNAPEWTKQECAQYSNALPVMIKNQEDQDYWASVARENHKKGNNNGYIFIGIMCNALARFRWADGSKITYRPPGYDYPELDEYCDNSNDSWAYKCMWAIDPVSNDWKEMCFTKHNLDVYCVYTPTYDRIDIDEDCSNFSHDGADDICYQVQKTPANFADARTMCYSFGAELASIHNDRENSFIRRLAVSKNLVSSLMIGGTKNDNNSFDWTDGTKFDYQNFAPGYPSSDSGDCLAMQTGTITGQWTNVNCSSNYPFACVRKTGFKMPACGTQYKEGDMIYSPGFPSTATEPCEFILTVAPGKIVEVEILFLEANACCDHLILTEGSSQIADLTGDQDDGRKFRTSSQNVMMASWQPKGGKNVRGMMITFREADKS